MREKGPNSVPSDIRLSLRLDLPDGARIGPGQIRLLEDIRASGSLRSAAIRLNMSYPKALKLVRHLNQLLRGGAVDLVQGGRGGGGARLTKAAEQLISLYREMETQSLSASQDCLGQLCALTRSAD